MILVIDNYDSFTFNLVQILLKLQFPVKVIKNDEWTIEKIQAQQNEIRAFLISPGPGHSREAKLSRKVVEHFAHSHPILGVCLGHQVIAEVFGATIVHAHKPMHGKRSRVLHLQKGCFAEIQSPVNVVRYHSLIVDEATVPKDFEIHAWSLTSDGTKEVMGLRHRSLKIEGLQFHPESILTEHGEQMVQYFFKLNTLTSAEN